MIVEFKYGNDDVVTDTITGFSGVVIAVTKWRNGCVRYLVQPQTLKDGKTITAESVDEDQLVLVKAAAPTKETKGKNPGGPFPSPTLAQDPA